jgi:hypothetical protein
MPAHVVLDCEDPEALAPFWCEQLGVNVRSNFEGGRHVIDRIHVEVMVEDLDEGTARAEALGGSWAEPGITRDINGFLWRCLQDPEGNISLGTPMHGPS